MMPHLMGAWRYKRENLLISGLLLLIIGASGVVIDPSFSIIGGTIGIFGIILFVWGFSTKPDDFGWTQEEIDAWRPKAESLPDAGRVMYRVDTTLYEPKKTTILCGACGHLSKVEGEIPKSFICTKCDLPLWEDEEE